MDIQFTPEQEQCRTVLQNFMGAYMIAHNFYLEYPARVQGFNVELASHLIDEWL